MIEGRVSENLVAAVQTDYSTMIGNLGAYINGPMQKVFWGDYFDQVI